MAAKNFVLSAFPMHGQSKLANEGYRTRDGHLIEWFGKLLSPRGTVEVVSRPEPFFLKRRYSVEDVAFNTHALDSTVFTLPNPFRRKEWWVRSSKSYPFERMTAASAIIAWNPFVFKAPRFEGYARGLPVVLDLLDDWSIHHGFASITGEVESAYLEAFRVADFVFANAEGTEALARRFGRKDVVLMPNGVDKARFTHNSSARGPIKVGYVGKIGRRVDLDLVLSTAASMPSVQFVFAGPILDHGYRSALSRVPNIDLLGDIAYSEVPKLLEGFDIGWVPHRVGRGEVGGDAIKIYEYNAAGLPVVTTPIDGAGKRGMRDVHVVSGVRHVEAIVGLIGEADRVPRVRPSLPAETAWQEKAQRILDVF